MKLIQNYLTNNDCYKSGRTITPIGIQIHSIGTGQNTATSLMSYWNQPGIPAVFIISVMLKQKACLSDPSGGTAFMGRCWLWK